MHMLPMPNPLQALVETRKFALLCSLLGTYVKGEACVSELVLRTTEVFLYRARRTVDLLANALQIDGGLNARL